MDYVLGVNLDSQEQFWIRCTGRYRIDLPTEPRTTAMADPLTPPAQGSNEAETAKRSVAKPPVSTSVSSRTDKRSVAKPPVSLQVGFYNIGWTDTQLSGQYHEMHLRTVRMADRAPNNRDGRP